MEDLITRVRSICDELAREDGTGGQVALAAAAGASKSVVNQWLAGKIKSMDISYALEIERSLGYNHIWLMIGKGERKIGSGEVASTQVETEKSRIPGLIMLDEMHRATLPRTEAPVNADVLAGIGFIAEDEARLLNLYRMATDGGRQIVMVTATASPKRQLSALVDDEPQDRLARTSDSNS